MLQMYHLSLNCDQKLISPLKYIKTAATRSSLYNLGLSSTPEGTPIQKVNVYRYLPL